MTISAPGRLGSPGGDGNRDGPMRTATSAWGRSAPGRYKFQPKKPVRTFRDLDVYRITLECSVIIAKSVAPPLTRLKYPFAEQMASSALSIPRQIAEAHSIRFNDFTLAVATLEKAMAGCNKLVVFLEQAAGLYGSKLDSGLVDDLTRRYADVRGKMFRLEKAWQKYRVADATPGSGGAFPNRPPRF